MILVYGLPLIVRITRAANVPLPPPTRLAELAAHFNEPAPPISIRRDEYARAVGALGGILAIEPGDEEGAWRRFAWIRSAYDPALRALAGLTSANPSPWTTDRPAKVGKPRFLRRRPLPVDFSVAVTPPEGSPAT